MKIALVYTPRCGSTSLFEYFKELKPNYICYKEPWFSALNNGNIIDYDKIISEDNVFIKSSYRHLIVPIEKIINDFDKVVFLSRKDKKEMIESLINVNYGCNFSDRSKKKYWIDHIDEKKIEEGIQVYDIIDKELSNFSIKYGNKMFYYEDLYYNDFTPMLKELELDLVQPQFDNLLNCKNRYRVDGEVKTKKHTTIF